MPRYAIKVVPNEWNDSMPLPFHGTTRAYGKIERGMHILIYQHGVGIVGDAEIHETFVSSEDWLDEPLPRSLAEADFLLPVGSIYYQGKVIAPAAVCQLLDDSTFPQLDGWRPIDTQLYEQFVRQLI